MYSIDQFQSFNQAEQIVITQHSRKRFMEREIRLEDVMNAIKTGQIIEDYPDDTPFPSCLISGRSGSKVIHVCASIGDGYMYVITAYVPNHEKWEADWKTRKGERR